MMNVSLPIVADAMISAGGDPFILLVGVGFIFPFVFGLLIMIMRCTLIPSLSLKPCAGWRVLLLVGFLVTMNGIMVVFASDSSRTPPYLQAILQTTIIPYTVVCRYLILRKGISLRRLVCTIVVLVGLFITTEPQIWGLDGSGGSSSGSISAINRVVWPMIFALGFLPVGIFGVICERELQKEQSGSLTFIFWTQIYQFITIVLMFWVDFIPWFGMASNPSEFLDRLKSGLGCMFSSGTECYGLAGKIWVFVIGYCLGNLFQMLLIEYAEGAVYAVVVQSIVTPVATIFWTLFKYTAADDHFFWMPEFNITTGFTMAGLVIIVPTVVIYNYFSNQEAKENVSHNRDIQKESVS
ncbi:uncharacterized protein LOC121390290 [Gigantopelta aegis]|uniref:uncharacterized protein LOC121390290 n=1 Tax=Gigantopelta aegis TaxID=1735272 RepID=UPI001B8898D7|nr:uncharacterized protein LOC121390290 [Gigantopelta aegis]